ncbi:hypothetical protein ACNAW0_27815 [Micromonospora sp. SL1-18]|uniref:hypothetical protein n=1 Tax=Micromonospora sp. SL1-18 TaxID=3399128 RepID=UPI003A4DB85D
MQERLIAHSPQQVRGQVLGLHQNGMMAGQAAFAALAGVIADRLPANWAVAAMAGLSLLATVALTRGLRGTEVAPGAEPETAPTLTPTADGRKARARPARHRHPLIGAAGGAHPVHRAPDISRAG